MPSMTDTESKRVAFLGLGRMGVAMAAHLTASGHELTVWNRTPGRAEPLVAAGAREAPTPAEAASDVDVVVLMLTGPDAVREVLFGEAGVAAGARSGTLVVDSSTIGPAAAREVARRLEEHGLRYVDAPVAGSVGPATQGTLGVLAGGAPDDVKEARPLLEAWGDPERVVHVGPVGAGSGLKLAVNLVMGVLADGLGEALRLVRELGVDRSTALRALGAGPAGWILQQKGAMLDAGDFSATAFSLDLLAKDLGLAAEAGERDLPAVRAALESARAAGAAGHGDEDYAALIGWLEGARG